MKYSPADQRSVLATGRSTAVSRRSYLNRLTVLEHHYDIEHGSGTARSLATRYGPFVSVGRRRPGVQKRRSTELTRFVFLCNVFQ